jgi:hypothetical protein
MRVREITEAVMSVGIQGRSPVSPGARGLMASRWKYKTVTDAAEPVNMKNAVARLASKLDDVEKIDYDSINDLMQQLCMAHAIDPKDLHKEFVKKYNLTPDRYAAKLKHDRKNRPRSV